MCQDMQNIDDLKKVLTSKEKFFEFRSKFVHLVLGTFFIREMTIEKQGLCNMCCEFMVCVDVQYCALVNVE